MEEDKLKGYNVKLVDGFPDKYKCYFCKLVFRDPIQTFRGERACKYCYFSMKRKNPDVCPIDKEPINDNEIFQDKHLMREIGQLKCYCNNKDAGCLWKGELLEIQKHHDGCDYNQIACDKCNNQILIRNKDFHQSKECLYRLITCNDCKIPIKANDLENHRLICPMKRVDCPYNCNEKPLFTELFDHFKSCSKLSINHICPFQLIGCPYQAIDSDNLNNHLKSTDHFLITVSVVKKLKEDYDEMQHELGVQQKNFKSLSKKYEKIEIQIKDVRGIIVVLQESLLNLSGTEVSVSDYQIKTFETKLNECKEKIDKLLPKKNMDDFLSLRPKIEELTSIADKIEVDNAVIGESISEIDLKLQMLENTRYDGKHLWRITDFRFRFKQAEEGKTLAIHSAPSFTSRGGYKFCSRLYLNGDGSGSKTHLSLYFVIMKSEYDQLLEWPFKKRVTFRLINVLDQAKSHVESFIPDINSSSFQRPVRDMNIAAGCPQFFPKESLFSPNYLVDDTIFLETIVSE
ncbi:TNF receptor-associated factor 5 isoform X1 [Hydra vulgaris]|nr:TNF receptor-associated factor 5 [Hydra vulgaris]